MHSLTDLQILFNEKFSADCFPATPKTLYEPNKYFLNIPGKRIRPILCLLSNQLYGEISEDCCNTAFALELFHNFTLIHDDIMDNADIRRGQPTVHKLYGSSTALLAGDVMLIKAYELLNKINSANTRKIIELFNTMAREVCEGQQLDMDFEQLENVDLENYYEMIRLKTSVLLATSFQLGAVVANASIEDQNNFYSLGINLGLAFQIQDDYLDCFGDEKKFGKKIGGDIIANKKTFLWLRALSVATEQQKNDFATYLNLPADQKIECVKTFYHQTKSDEWAINEKNRLMNLAIENLAQIKIDESRKQPIRELIDYLLNRTS